MEMGMHTEQLSGRSQQVFFSSEEADNYTYPWADEVDFDKSTEIDAEGLESKEVNLKIRDAMRQGYGTIRVLNPAGIASPLPGESITKSVASGAYCQIES